MQAHVTAAQPVVLQPELINDLILVLSLLLQLSQIISVPVL